MDNVTEIKDKLPDYLSLIGLSTQKNFTCLNPEHDDKNPSMAYDAKNERVHCFGCGATWDIYDLIAVEELNAPVTNGKPEYSFPEAYNQAIKTLGLSLPAKKSDKTSSDSNKGGSRQRKDQKQVINRKNVKTSQRASQRQNKAHGNLAEKTKSSIKYMINLSNTLLDSNKLAKVHVSEAQKQAHEQGVEYLHRRGISEKTARKYGLGVMTEWCSMTTATRLQAQGKDTKQLHKSPRIIIPTGEYSYVARDMRENIPESEKKYKKMKDGPARFFNSEALNINQNIYIVEGEFDALAIAEAGQEAIALGSTAMVNQFAKLVKWHKDQRPDNFYPTLLLALDNDNAGKLATRKLTAQLQQLNVNYYEEQIARGYKDANGALIVNREQFIVDVNRTANNPDSRLQMWVDTFSKGTENKAIATGFKNLDECLDGGLFTGLYCLGAISSLGKTTFTLQIADHVASTGTPVLYFALEMSWEEMTSKSISRTTALNELAQNGNYDEHLAQTTRSLEKGDWGNRYNSAQLENLNESISVYGGYASNIKYYDGKEKRLSAQDVSDIVDNYIARTGQRPLVIVDYLQILAPINDRATDKANVTTSANLLKKIATRHNLPVMAISSFNRQKYNEQASMESFKESGDIEYSADVLLGLQLQGVEETDFDVNEAKQKDPREVELTVLKNRNGRTGDVLEYSYSSPFNLFVSTGTRDQPEEEYSLPALKETNVRIDDQGRLNMI